MDSADRTRSAAQSDVSWQSAILSRVLFLHPARLSTTELRREMLVDEQQFSEVETCDRAVRDLVAVGLLRRAGDCIEATRAAACFAALEL